MAGETTNVDGATVMVVPRTVADVTRLVGGVTGVVGGVTGVVGVVGEVHPDAALVLPLSGTGVKSPEAEAAVHPWLTPNAPSTL